MRYTFQDYHRSEILRDHLKLGGGSPRGGRIEVNSLYLERDGRPWIGVMGEFHFSRYDRGKWYEELCKMRAGGITIVSTYLFWIYHEETEGEFDFSGRQDIRAFILEARRAGLEAVIRVGPWAHGECRNGGLPDWILRKSYPVRQNHPDYLEKVRIWYRKIGEQVQGLFYGDGGNIIGVQLENELVDRPEHLRTLKKIAQEEGLIAPLYTVTGWNSRYGAKIPKDEVLPVFGGYPEAPWTDHLEPLPPNPRYAFDRNRNDSAIGVDVMKDTDQDGWRLPYERYPFATCELGGGMQATHHRRPIVSGMDIYALALVSLGSGNNLPGYYMYHGGTNQIGRYSTLQESKKTGYPNDYSILSYDFQAPVSEYGEIRESYRLLNLLHLFLGDFGARLAPMELTECRRKALPEDTETLRCAVRTDGERGFVFVNHYSRLQKLTPAEAEFEVCGVRFPAVRVDGEIGFFLPFRMELGDEELEYATAQPICRSGNTYFFAAVPGIAPEYRFADGETVCAAAGETGRKPGGNAGRDSGKNAAGPQPGDGAETGETGAEFWPGDGTETGRTGRESEKIAAGMQLGGGTGTGETGAGLQPGNGTETGETETETWPGCGTENGKAAVKLPTGSGVNSGTVSPGRYGFTKNGVRIVTLSWEEALYLRRLDGELVLGDRCDLYRADGEIRCVQEGSFSYRRWTGEGWEDCFAERPFSQAKLRMEETPEAPCIREFAAYEEELQLGGARRLTWKKLTVSGPQGFVEIPDVCDAAQIYVDGRLAADQYYCGKPWRIPAGLLYGKDCRLVYSEMKDDFYREF